MKIQVQRHMVKIALGVFLTALVGLVDRHGNETGLQEADDLGVFEC